MKFSAHTIRRLASLAGLAAVVAAVAVPTALAHPAEGGGNTARRRRLRPGTARWPCHRPSLHPTRATSAIQSRVAAVDPAIATAMARHKALR